MKRFGRTMMNTANTSDAAMFAPSTCSASNHIVLTKDTVVLAVSLFVALVLCRIHVLCVLIPLVLVVLRNQLHMTKE